MVKYADDLKIIIRQKTKTIRFKIIKERGEVVYIETMWFGGRSLSVLKKPLYAFLEFSIVFYCWLSQHPKS